MCVLRHSDGSLGAKNQSVTNWAGEELKTLLFQPIQAEVKHWACSRATDLFMKALVCAWTHIRSVPQSRIQSTQFSHHLTNLSFMQESIRSTKCISLSNKGKQSHIWQLFIFWIKHKCMAAKSDANCRNTPKQPGFLSERASSVYTGAPPR